MFGLLPPSSSETFLMVPAAWLHDAAAGLCLAGEGNLVDIGVAGQRLADDLRRDRSGR